jgi:hypothetical protein
MSTAVDTREAWLIRAAERLAELLGAVGEEMPPIRVSVGWPGGRGKKSNVVGQCWPTSLAEDGVAQIFMSPVRGEDKTVDVLGTLLHEMIHAVDDCESGHRGNFARIAKAVGFVPKLTSADNRNDDLNAKLAEIAKDLDVFPHAALTSTSRRAAGEKGQTTRMLKVVCPADDYTLRTTQKWIDVGLPTCPCGTEMVTA